MPKNSTVLNNILYSCYDKITREGEHFIPEHVFSYLLSGSQVVHAGDKTYHFNAGDYRFFRKNQLSRFVKKPSGDSPFKSISIRMDQETLRSMSAEYQLHTDHPYTGGDNLLLAPNVLFENFIGSLAPYMDGSGESNKALSTLKVKEAVLLLLQTNPELKNVLFDFSEPGKIDLEAYMNKNYAYNADISRFAYLTGRSLAAFKRDFEQIFHMSPNRWLQQKRLQDAYYLIKEKNAKVTDVYLEVGFKDLSHFSFAFKKAYGITPSKL